MKPALDYADARDLFDQSEERLDLTFEDNYDDCLDSFMDRQGYEWNEEAQEYRDMASEQANKDKAE